MAIAVGAGPPHRARASRARFGAPAGAFLLVSGVTARDDLRCSTSEPQGSLAWRGSGEERHRRLHRLHRWVGRVRSQGRRRRCVGQRRRQRGINVVEHRGFFRRRRRNRCGTGQRRRAVPDALPLPPRHRDAHELGRQPARRLLREVGLQLRVRHPGRERHQQRLRAALRGKRLHREARDRQRVVHRRPRRRRDRERAGDGQIPRAIRPASSEGTTTSRRSPSTPTGFDRWTATSGRSPSSASPSSRRASRSPSTGCARSTPTPSCHPPLARSRYFGPGSSRRRGIESLSSRRVRASESATTQAAPVRARFRAFSDQIRGWRGRPRASARAPAA